ncbi:MAG: hypothetical protein M1834_001632 [Cirrosporium novae-zelandiae]|nr:MAG: hypothetical protein M1834_004149 [Cirrosporium novae-zelandiae]KAI9735616.1 MAG: hypothetical protein M1834_001632 [Cirrosporium novae-zelandiae]
MKRCSLSCLAETPQAWFSNLPKEYLDWFSVRDCNTFRPDSSTACHAFEFSVEARDASRKDIGKPNPTGALTRKSFLDLPGELRDQIYKNVLILDEQIRIVRFHRQRKHRQDLASLPDLNDTNSKEAGNERDWKNLPPGHACLALAYTCWKIYSEAICYYYNENTFWIPDPTAQDKFIYRLGPKLRPQIHSLSFPTHTETLSRTITSLTSLAKIRFYLDWDVSAEEWISRTDLVEGRVLEPGHMLFELLPSLREVEFARVGSPTVVHRLNWMSRKVFGNGSEAADEEEGMEDVVRGEDEEVARRFRAMVL